MELGPELRKRLENKTNRLHLAKRMGENNRNVFYALSRLVIRSARKRESPGRSGSSVRALRVLAYTTKSLDTPTGSVQRFGSIWCRRG